MTIYYFFFTNTADAGESNKSSDNQQAVIIGSAVGGVLALLLVFGLVAFCLVKRRSSGASAPTRKGKERKPPPRNVLNAAYDPESHYQGSGPTYSQGGYEMPHDYAQLEPPKDGRVPIHSSYESLRPREQRPVVDQDSGNYVQLDSNRKEYSENENYAKLYQDQKAPATGKEKEKGLENRVTNDPIYEELS